jgi:hypothetical protein
MPIQLATEIAKRNSRESRGESEKLVTAPLKELQRKFGFEPGQVAAAAREQLRQT